MGNVTSISLDQEDADYLKENGIPLSAFIREKIREDHQKMSVQRYELEIDRLNQECEKLQLRLDQYYEFLAANQLLEKYRDWRMTKQP